MFCIHKHIHTYIRFHTAYVELALFSVPFSFSLSLSQLTLWSSFYILKITSFIKAEGLCTVCVCIKESTMRWIPLKWNRIKNVRWYTKGMDKEKWKGRKMCWGWVVEKESGRSKEQLEKGRRTHRHGQTEKGSVRKGVRALAFQLFTDSHFVFHNRCSFPFSFPFIAWLCSELDILSTFSYGFLLQEIEQLIAYL